MKPIINGQKDMEDLKKKMGADMNDKEIVFSKSIKAGKRIYYLDVKKVIMGEGDDSQVSFEKHKIFLYKEDFEKFTLGLAQAMDFINLHQTSDSDCLLNEPEPQDILLEEVKDEKLDNEIKIDIDF